MILPFDIPSFPSFSSIFLHVSSPRRRKKGGNRAAHGEAQEVVGPLRQARGEAAQLWVFHLIENWSFSPRAMKKILLSP